MRIVFIYTQIIIKAVLFQTIQFDISTQFRSIWTIDMILSGVTQQGYSGTSQVMTVRKYSIFHKASALLEPHHQIV